MLLVFLDNCFQYFFSEKLTYILDPTSNSNINALSWKIEYLIDALIHKYFLNRISLLSTIKSPAFKFPIAFFLKFGIHKTY